MGIVVDELVTLLGLEAAPGNEQVVNRLNQGLDGIQKAGKVAGAALVAAGGATLFAAKRFAETTDETGKFANSVDIGVSKLQELEFAAERSGGSADALRGDLTNLANQFGSAEVGIDMLIKQFDGLSDQEARLAGQSFGISEGTLRLLREGEAGIADLRAEFRALGGGLPDDATKNAADFNDALTNLKTSFSGLSGTVLNSLLPAFTKATEGVTGFLVQNREVIASGIGVFIDGISLGFSKAGDIINTVTNAFGGLSNTLSPITSLFGGLSGEIDTVDVIANIFVGTLGAIALAFAPVIAKITVVTGLIIGIGAAINDLFNFFTGGESVIGSFFASFSDSIDPVFEVVDNLLGVFKNLFGFVGEGAAKAFEGVKNIAGKIGGFFGFGDDDAASATAASPAVAEVPASVVNNSSQSSNTTNNFNINGAGDPAGVAAEVSQRGGFGQVSQTAEPGQRAPRVS